MRIARLTPSQVPAVTEMARRAYEWGTGKRDYNAAISIGAWTGMVASGTGVVLAVVDGERPVGLLCGYRAVNIDTGKLTAQMWHWFVEPEAKGWGLQLLREFERWAAEHGCKRIAIGCNANLWTEKHHKIYARKGYELEGLNFSKER